LSLDYNNILVEDHKQRPSFPATASQTTLHPSQSKFYD